MPKIIIPIIAVLFAISCQDRGATSINGAWESIGHGKILEIKDSTSYTYFDITAISCFPVKDRAFKEIKPYLSLSNDTLTLVQGPFNYKFKRIEEMPELCRNIDPSKTNDPLYNFEVFMQTVKENYAFMELNNINWDQLYRTQKEKFKSSTTEAELYLILEETYELLNDNHAYLNAPDAIYDELDKIAPVEDESDGLPEYGDFVIADLVTKSHLQENMTKDSWIINWGMLTDEIGYIQIKAMWLYGDLDMPETLIESEGYVDAYGITRVNMLENVYMEKEVEGVNKTMRNVINDLSNTESIVIDVRFNGGGQIVASYAILEHFNTTRMQIATQQYRYGNHHTPPNALYLKSNKNAYTKPVYVLTSPQSGSGAEIFALTTRAMPHVKRIGSATEGAMSMTLDKKLPNGWDFTVSSAVYRDNEGKYYENIGVPVDYDLNYIRGDRQGFFRSVANNLEKDKQTILEAIEVMEKK